MNSDLEFRMVVALEKIAKELEYMRKDGVF